MSSSPASAIAAPPLARRVAELGLFLLGACALTIPDGLLPFAVCLLLSTLLALPTLRLCARRMGHPLRVLSWLCLAVLGFAVLSILLFEHGLRDVDSRSRFVLLPWAAIWAYGLRPQILWLWRGALVGIVLALLLALWQVWAGAARAEGWSNAIVFADIVLLLLVLVVFCRPSRRWSWVLPALLVGCCTIVLSGSRGVWLGLLCLLVTVVGSARWRDRGGRLLIVSGALVLAATLLLTIPGLERQTRLVELQTDLHRLEHGDADSSAGARLELWQVAYDSLRQQPLTGVGIGRFGELMEQQPICRIRPALGYCRLGHAHNDLAEWGATQGVPGLLLLVAVYGLPLWLLLQLHRRSGRARFVGPAAAGVMVVLAFILCGMTQSMFSHQITTSCYTVLIGILIGVALGEVHDRDTAAANL